MENDSPLQRLARTTLRQDPFEWVEHLRGAGWSWQRIADELSTTVGVPVSRETVRLWAEATAKAEAQS